MQYCENNSDKSNIEIREKILTIKGKDGEVNLSILCYLFKESGLSFVDVAKKLAEFDPKYGKGPQADYGIQKKKETIAFKHLKILSEKGYTSTVIEKGLKVRESKRYSLTRKGWYTLFLVYPSTITQGSKDRHFLDLAFDIEKDDGITENIFMMKEPSKKINEILGRYSLVGLKIATYFLKKGIMLGDINFDDISNNRVNGLITSYMAQLFIFPNQYAPELRKIITQDEINRFLTSMESRDVRQFGKETLKRISDSIET